MGTGKLAPKKSKKLEGKSQINKRLNLGESELGVGERGLGFGWDHLLLFLSNDFFFLRTAKRNRESRVYREYVTNWVQVRVAGNRRQHL